MTHSICPHETSSFSDPTLAMWHSQDKKNEPEKAEKRRRQGRVTELQCAFIGVRSGMPDSGDDEQDARAFAARWGHLARLLTAGPDLVHCPLDKVEAKAHSPKGYALRFVTAALANEADAAKLLLDSWRASRKCHGEVLGWLMWRLEAEIMGTNTQAISNEPSLAPADPGVKQPPFAITAAAASQPLPAELKPLETSVGCPGAVNPLDSGSPPAPVEEWLPASKAAERAEQSGHPITLKWLTKDARIHGVRIRPRQQAGKHRREVEWSSLAG